MGWSLLRPIFDLLHRLTADALARQATSEGIAYARRSLVLDNWREEAHRQLMHLLALDGRRSDALAQYESCRRLLAENLGVAASRLLDRARPPHFGETRPTATEEDAITRAMNRRVELFLVKGGTR